MVALLLADYFCLNNFQLELKRQADTAIGIGKL